MYETVFDPKPYADVEKAEIKVEKKNIKVGKSILPILFSEGGELTAGLFYRYHAAKLCADLPELYEILLAMADVEVRHYDNLSAICALLGADPKPRVESRIGPIFWTGSFLKCDSTLQKFFLAAIRGERQAVRDYERLIPKIEDEYVAVVLHCNMLDEKIHLANLEKLRERFVK